MASGPIQQAGGSVRRVFPAITRRIRDLRGLPPSLPFARDEAAFRLDFTAPRHAGQKHTRSMRWIGHFGIELASC